jgi:hypothetical protein
VILLFKDTEIVNFYELFNFLLTFIFNKGILFVHDGGNVIFMMGIGVTPLHCAPDDDHLVIRW